LMDFGRSLLLGLLQGLTEFLPVSSSGHLVIVQHLLGVGGDMFFFDVVVHGATLLAVVVYFRRELKVLLRSLLGLPGEAPVELPCATAKSLWLSLVVGTVPAVLVGLTLKSEIESLFASRQAAPAFLLLTGVFLLVTRSRRDSERGVSAGTAFLIGLAQGLAILPGISRSGWTIGAAILIGVNRRKSVQFSFLLSIPAVAGALLYELVQAGSVEGQAVSAVLAGAAIAFLSGLLAIRILFGFSSRGRLELFGLYCLAAGTFAFLIL